MPNPEVQELITRNANVKKIREAAVKGGMVTLRLDGLQKAKAGITTIDEVLRVTTSDE